MHRNDSRISCTLTILAAALLASGPALADKPSAPGGGKDGKHAQQDRRGERDDKQRDRDVTHARERERLQPGINVYFVDRHRTLAHDYYAGQFRAGHCPPGLAKKRNGCLPPGQAKKWQIGRPLPREVIFFDLPPALVVELGPPPAGYRFVRVASDILLIAIGTGMVIDAIEDLGRMM